MDIKNFSKIDIIIKPTEALMLAIAKEIKLSDDDNEIPNFITNNAVYSMEISNESVRDNKQE